MGKNKQIVRPPNKGITLEHIQKAAEYIYNNEKNLQKERTLSMIRRCLTFGIIKEDLGSFPTYCENPECFYCQNYAKMVDGLIRESVNESADAPNIEDLPRE